MSARKGRKWGSHWGQSLNPAQRATVKRILAKHAPGHRSLADWRVLTSPTTGPARYVELRHYFRGGTSYVSPEALSGVGMARWVIEPDGTVSAHNHEGQSRTLVATGAAVLA